MSALWWIPAAVLLVSIAPLALLVRRVRTEAAATATALDAAVDTLGELGASLPAADDLIARVGRRNREERLALRRSRRDAGVPSDP